MANAFNSAAREQRQAEQAARQAERQAARNNRTVNDGITSTPTPTPATTTPVASSAENLLLNTTENALASDQAQALQNYYNSASYQFPLQQGLEGVNAYYAGRGQLQSGAALKGIEDYAANAAAGGLNDYMTALGNQQATGAQAASAQAGVASNYANTISSSANNYANSTSSLNQNYANNASNLYSNYANAQSNYATNTANINNNATVANTNNTNSLISGIGNAVNGGVTNYLAYKGYV